MLGLMGDAVDNIPGIPGIGEKTAQKLIADFGSVENLIASADQLKGKLKENVVNLPSKDCCPNNWQPFIRRARRV